MHKRIDFQSDQTLLFIGDSITDCKRLEPAYSPLGRGYVNFAANFLQAKRPDLQLTIENRGIGGDTTRDLLRRWEVDCIELKPDIVSLMIGINDLWRKFGSSPESRSMYVDPDEYENNVRTLLTRTREACDPQLILMEPFMFCDDPSNEMLQALPAYIEIVHKLADEFDATLVPVFENYVQLKDKRPADQWTTDTVHPYEWVHAWIARQWLTTVL